MRWNILFTINRQWAEEAHFRKCKTTFFLNFCKCVIEVSVCQFDSYVGVSLSVWCKGGVQNANSRKNYILFFDSNLGGLRKTNHSMPKYVMG